MMPPMADIGRRLQDDLLVDLTRRYGEPHRRYHTSRPIANMLYAGRELLAGFLVKERIFHTAWGSRFETPARPNIERALADLLA